MGTVQKKISTKGKVRWIGRYYLRSGREVSRTFDKKGDASRWVVEQESLRDSGHIVTGQRVKVSAAFKLFTNRTSITPGTRAVYDNIFRTLLTPIANLYVDDISQGDVDAWYLAMTTGRSWISKTDKGISATTARRAVVALNSMMIYCSRNGYCAKRTFDAGKSASTLVLAKDLPTDAEVKALTRELYKGKKGVAQLVTLISMTGLRVSEASGLTPRDVDIDKGTITISAQLSPKKERVPLKTGRRGIREIPLPTASIEWLKELMQGKDSDDFLITTARGHAITATYAGAAVRSAVANAGIATKITPHTLRHLYASRLLAAGLSIPEVSALLGHATSVTTMSVYAHVLPAHHEQRARKIDATTDSSLLTLAKENVNASGKNTGNE